MTDEDDGRPFPEPADRGEDALDLVVGERGGRLVEDEDPGAAHHPAGDLDELLLGQRQLLAGWSRSTWPRPIVSSCWRTSVA